ncbi:hypothetical protein [Runella sp.]|uniref:hypothetical protein n=1 Tax=Runella sp. TaxID=1960881 RepID=UPI003D0DD6A9
MVPHHAICPITGFEVVLCKTLEDNFRGIRFIIPCISENLLISIADNILHNNEIRETLTNNRDKFVKNLQMVSRFRQETIISTGNWWLFVK